MKRILHIIESLEFGGAEMVLINLANTLSEKYTVSICMTKRQGDLCSRVNSRVKLHFLDCKEGNDLSAITKIMAIIKKDNIDIVHAHNWSVYLEAVLAAKLAGTKKIIHTIHGPYMASGTGYNASLKKSVRRFLENLFSLAVYRFVPVSLAIKSYLLTDFRINPEKITPIHNGIAALDRSLKNHSDSQILRLITVGRVAKIKNHTMMLTGLRKALDSGAQVNLTIVGDGPELTAMRTLCTSLKLDHAVEFLGFRTDIAHIMSDKDVYILTSDYEGISIALLEAMSLGLPAIATAVGGVPETVLNQQTGLLIDKNNARALADAILFMANNKSERIRFGNAAYAFFLREFEEKIFIKKYDDIYAS
jgi:glycosyltransferase involved in cell wall biosynthesis